MWDAYQQVKANRGGPGVDGVSIEVFDKDLKNNLYKIWNRMSSGTYFPPAVKAVEIAKAHGGGTRMLGVPTVADRVAQTVVARRLEAKVEPVFHPDSYGYRPARSALDAVGVCRQRCWKYDWVIDMDIQKFFDSVDHALMLKAVEKHTDVSWIVLYVKRWLVAPLQLTDGTMQERDRGTPQGSAVSPVLANLFMHYAFDMWMAREHPGNPFERYADDVVVHCVTLGQAQRLVAEITARMGEVGLTVHPDKTKIVYCGNRDRRAAYEHTAFTFLGYTFRYRGARNERDQVTFTAFTPAISKDALKKISGTVRRWRLGRRTNLTLADIARRINPVVRGWMQYYGRFNRSALYPLLQRINAYLVRFLRNKFKRVRSFKKAKAGWQRITVQSPKAFAHWAWITTF
ncbi:group II intron reverse transcriptase/maturase [Actinoplanes sp. NPDC049599]|uniref:group II intron reverse transcriptase/maturase n=1 Tax=Actinoplanes sp. NPDC049599 TaxID=3363903 RepID=UPI00378BF214